MLRDTCTNIVLMGNMLWQWPIILKDVCNRSHMNKKRNKIIALQNPNPEADSITLTILMWKSVTWFCMSN